MGDTPGHTVPPGLAQLARVLVGREASRCWEPEGSHPSCHTWGLPSAWTHAPSWRVLGWVPAPLGLALAREGGRGWKVGAELCPSHLQSLNFGGCWAYTPAPATKARPQSHRSELGLRHLWWPRDLGWGDSGAPLPPLSPSSLRGMRLPVTQRGGGEAGAAGGDGGSPALVMNPSLRSSRPNQILDFPEGGRSALTPRRRGSARRGWRLGLIRGHRLKGSRSRCPRPLRLF